MNRLSCSARRMPMLPRISVVSVVSPLIALLFAIAITPRANAQQSGSVDFIARVSPTGGHPEPVREFTFFLLSKNFQDIKQEAEAAEPAPKMDDFVDKLDVSPELKTWMKKQQIAEFSGPEFTKALTPKDILGVPEFKDAYMTRNTGDPTVILPQPPKMKEADKKKYPEKYKQLTDDYLEALKRYIAANPETLSSMNVALAKINPGLRWKKLVNERNARVQHHALELAQLQYLAGKTDTDLDGRGHIGPLVPGDYWLTTLDTEATSGDAHVRWNLAVHVASGHINLELSNVNGVESRIP